MTVGFVQRLSWRAGVPACRSHRMRIDKRMDARSTEMKIRGIVSNQTDSVVRAPIHPLHASTLTYALMRHDARSVHLRSFRPEAAGAFAGVLPDQGRRRSRGVAGNRVGIEADESGFRVGHLWSRGHDAGSNGAGKRDVEERIRLHGHAAP